MIKSFWLEKKSGLFTAIISIWTSFSMVYTFAPSKDVLVAAVPVFAIIFFMFISSAKSKACKLTAEVNLFSLILAIITSCALYFSSNIIERFDQVFSSFFSVALFVFTVSGLAISVYYIFVLFFVKFTKTDFAVFDKKISLKDYFLAWAIIFVGWVIVWSFYFPGVSTSDTYTQMYICNGNLPLSNNHPFIHTLLVYVTTRFTNFNPWLTVLVQMLIMSSIYAYLCYWMKKHNVWKWLHYATIAYFAFFPVHPYNAITMVKDSLFSAFVLLYSIFIYEIVHSKGIWLKNAKNFLLYLSAATLVTLFRSNGIMIVFLTAVIGLFFVKKLLGFSFANILSISLYALTVYGIYPILGVESTSISEAMAIPLQQLCCAIAEGHNLSENITNYMNEILPLEQIRQNYDPQTVDTIKFHNMYNGSIIANDLTGFFKIWFAGLLEQPLVYVKAYLAETEGLWNPLMRVGMFEPYQAPNFFTNAEMKPLFPVLAKIYDTAVNISYLSQYAFFSRVFYNPAIYYIVMCLCGLVMKLKNKPSYMGVLIPVFALWVSVAVSMPRATVGRYVYAVFACMPLIIFVASKAVNPNKNNTPKQEQHL